MIQASGLASGVDTSSIVSQLVNIERQPLSRLAAQKTTYSRQISRLGAFSSLLSDFQDKLSDFSSASSLLSKTVGSENEDAMTIKATGDAQPGTWEVEVEQLARAQRDKSTAFDSPDAEVKAGTLSIEVWGEDAVDITIEDGMTLTDVRDLIQESGAKVNASIIQVDSGTYLSVTSQKTGHDGGAGMVITESGSGNGNGNGNNGNSNNPQSLGFSTEIAAQNAIVHVDGEQVTHTDNSVDGVLEGMTLELEGESTEPFMVTVGEDSSAVAEKVEDLIKSYNSLYSAANSLKNEDHRFGTTAANSLRKAMTDAVSGSSFPNLSSIGISTSKDTGGLILDKTKFEEAMSKDPSGVVELFGTEDTGIVSRMDSLIERYTDSYDGLIKSSKDMWQSRITSADATIERGELRIEAYEARLKRQFTAMEQMISGYSDMSSRFASMLPPVQTVSSGS